MKNHIDIMKKIGLAGVFILLIVALTFMTIPNSEADAKTSASEFIIEGGKLTLYKGSDKTVTIPSTVDEIGESAFEKNLKVEKVILSDSVQSIGAYAFWGCDHLHTVTLGKGLKKIDDYAFAGCKGLESITLSSRITEIGIQAFGDCVNLKDVYIPKETTKIHDSAFTGCDQIIFHCEDGTVADEFAERFQIMRSRLQEKASEESSDKQESKDEDVEESVPFLSEEELIEKIREEAGESIGSSKVVGNRAMIFLPVTDLQVIDGQIQSENKMELIGDLYDTELSKYLPKYTIVDHQIIADQAYYQNQNLDKVVLPDEIQEIGEFSFARSSITSIVIPNGVTDIDYGAFYHCEELAEVCLPQTIIHVEPQAFSATAWLTDFQNSDNHFLISGGVLVAYQGTEQEVRIPENVTVIAGEAFSGNDEIKKLYLPDQLKVIGEAAFENCSSLEYVQLGEKTEKIEDRAFDGCDQLKEIILPDSVKEVGIRALGNADITYAGTMPKQTYETSATILKNESYRYVDDREEQDVDEEGEITVLGDINAEAYLLHMDRHYNLEIHMPEESDELSRACERAFDKKLPQNSLLLELVLKDFTDIPLVRLGENPLTVILETPKSLQDQQLRILTVDRNGQAEMIDVVSEVRNEKKVIVFQTDFLSSYCIYGIKE